MPDGEAPMPAPSWKDLAAQAAAEENTDRLVELIEQLITAAG
jgi:hypothetical protein